MLYELVQVILREMSPKKCKDKEWLNQMTGDIHWYLNTFNVTNSKITESMMTLSRSTAFLLKWLDDMYRGGKDSVLKEMFDNCKGMLGTHKLAYPKLALKDLYPVSPRERASRELVESWPGASREQAEFISVSVQFQFSSVHFSSVQFSSFQFQFSFSSVQFMSVAVHFRFSSVQFISVSVQFISVSVQFHCSPSLRSSNPSITMTL